MTTNLANLYWGHITADVIEVSSHSWVQGQPCYLDEDLSLLGFIVLQVTLFRTESVFADVSFGPFVEYDALERHVVVVVEEWWGVNRMR